MSHVDEAAVIDLPGGDRLVLYGFEASAPDRGAIMRRLPDGRRLWIVRPPESDGQDAFVSMDLLDDALIADTWQGLRTRIDLETGAIRGSAFVK